MNDRRILTLTGPSCAGKSTLAQALEKTGRYREAVSVTTRPPRPGETHGVHYHFITPIELEGLDAQGQLIERVDFSGHSYGVTSNEVERCANEGKHAIVVCDQYGAGMIGQFACRNERPMVAAFLEIDPIVAIHRLCERLNQERAREGAIPGYARRLTKAVTDERDWKDVFDFDLRLPASLGPDDTHDQIQLIDQAIDAATAPGMREVRPTHRYCAELIERTMNEIEDVLRQTSGTCPSESKKTISRIAGVLQRVSGDRSQKEPGHESPSP